VPVEVVSKDQSRKPLLQSSLEVEEVSESERKEDRKKVRKSRDRLKGLERSKG
jgi:hypothetical protein